MFPTVAEILGEVCSCGRELCWRQLGLKPCKPYLLHVLWSVRILFEQTSYTWNNPRLYVTNYSYCVVITCDTRTYHYTNLTTLVLRYYYTTITLVLHYYYFYINTNSTILLLTLPLLLLLHYSYYYQMLRSQVTLKFELLLPFRTENAHSWHGWQSHSVAIHACSCFLQLYFSLK